MAWADTQVDEIMAAKAAGAKVRPYSEFRAEAEARGLAPPRKTQSPPPDTGKAATPTPAEPATDSSIEARARQIAATKMGLVKDPTGSRLPDDLWRQAIPYAIASVRADATLQAAEVLRKALTELRAVVRGESPSLLDDDGGTGYQLDAEIEAALTLADALMQERAAPRCTDRSVPCPTCGFHITRVEKPPLVIEDDER